MSLTDKRTFYKPFEMPWCYEAYKTQQMMHWTPTEVVLAEDVKDWSFKLTAKEKHLLTQVFRFFVQSDTDIAAAYVDNYLPVFKQPEVRMMLLSFGATEAIHMEAYSLLIDTIGMPETEYSIFAQYKAMADKHEFIEQFMGQGPDKIAQQLAVFSAFTEGLQLFSSFVILLNFSRFGLMKGMGQIVSWSIKDESHHVESMVRLFREFVGEHPKIWTASLKKEIYEIAKKMVELEDCFIDLAFEEGEVRGLTPEEVKTYIRHIGDRRLLQLGLKPIFKQKTNPLPWVDWLVNGVEHSNFFETPSTEYAKGSLTGSWGDVWGCG